jgi:hypothetical protein
MSLAMKFEFEGTVLARTKTTFTCRFPEDYGPFRPNRFRVLRGILECTIHELHFGHHSQLLNANPIPAAVFSPAASDGRIVFDTLSPGVDVTLVVENISDKPVVFEGELVRVEDPYVS